MALPTGNWLEKTRRGVSRLGQISPYLLTVDEVDATFDGSMAANPALLDRTVEEFRRTLTEIGGQPSWLTMPRF